MVGHQNSRFPERERERERDSERQGKFIVRSKLDTLRESDGERERERERECD
jgi:hypothetical protein